ncbi:MAG: hypothetical protein H0W61_10640 [Bacteroidetes bacterium]|nr:hypothetical protein [Bacteroidota bacterium]
MSYAFYSFLILIGEGSNASIEDLKTELNDFYKDDARGVKLTLNGSLLTLNVNDWKLYIRYNSDSHVLKESQELAEEFAGDKPEKNQIAVCASRFEMSADPDVNMDYFNDSLFAQEKIEDFSNVFVFDANARGFLNL